MLRTVLLGSLTLMAHTALAQDVRLPAVPEAMQASSGGMLLREVVIEGRKLLSPQDVAGFGQDYIGKFVGLDAGLKLIRDLKSTYRTAGYGDITVRMDVNRSTDGRMVFVVDESRAILRPALENPRTPLKLPVPPHALEMATPNAPDAPITPIAPVATIEEPKAPEAPELPTPVEPIEPVAEAAPAVEPEAPKVTPLREAAKNIYLIDEGKPTPLPVPDPEPLPEPVPEVITDIVPEVEQPAPVAPVTAAEKAEIMEQTPSAPTIVAPVEQSPRVVPMDIPDTPEVEAETIVERPIEQEKPSTVINRTIQSWKTKLFGGADKAAEE